VIASKRACVNVNASSPLINKRRSVMRKTRCGHSVYIRNADGDWGRFPLASTFHVSSTGEGDLSAAVVRANDEKGGKTYAQRGRSKQGQALYPFYRSVDPSPLPPRRCARKQVGRSRHERFAENAGNRFLGKQLKRSRTAVRTAINSV